MYIIICTELPNILNKLYLSLAVKAINDNVGLKGLVPMLLVFRAYLKLLDMSSLSLGIYTRATAVHKAIKELNNIQA